MADIALEEQKEKKGLVEKAKEVVVKSAKTIGLSKDKIVGTKEYEERVDELERGSEVLQEWADGETLYSQLYDKMDEYRNFYLGEDAEQGVADLEGELAIVCNLGATVIDLFTYILSNNPPEVQFKGDDTDPLSQTEANYKEDLTRRLLSDAHFHLRFRDGCKNQFMIGWCWLYPFWNKDKKLGGKNGSFDLTVLNPFTTRVRFKSMDHEEIESFITTKRMSPAEILKRYNFEALPDSEDPYLPKTFDAQDDGMTTVFTRYGENDIRVVINGREVKRIRHGLGFCPLIHVPNIKVPNDIHGHSEIERWEELAQEINALLSAASEIARDLAYPPILEYNNALGGRKIPKWRGMQIPVKRSDRGESVEFMRNLAQIAPLIKQTQLLVDLFHFVSLMPKAAGGIFPANITSGFQAKLAMQPATLTTDSRKIDWEWAIKRLVKMAFAILKKNDPDALKIKIDKKRTIEISEVYDHEMQIVWPQNLPIDIAREIQNLVLGIQNNLTSLHQAIDRYNVLMGMGSPSETIDFLRQEANDPELGPERALKVRQVQAKIRELLEGFQSMNEKLEAIRAQMNQGQSLPENLRETARQTNATNLARSATSPLPEERRAYPETAREAVTPESAGGKVVTPERT